MMCTSLKFQFENTFNKISFVFVVSCTGILLALETT